MPLYLICWKCSYTLVQKNWNEEKLGKTSSRSYGKCEQSDMCKGKISLVSIGILCGIWKIESFVMHISTQTNQWRQNWRENKLEPKCIVYLSMKTTTISVRQVTFFALLPISKRCSISRLRVWGEYFRLNFEFDAYQIPIVTEKQIAKLRHESNKWEKWIWTNMIYSWSHKYI